MGIDVHAESWHVTALSAGKERFHGGIPGEYPALGKLLNRLSECQIRAAYESILVPDPISDRVREGTTIWPKSCPLASKF